MRLQAEFLRSCSALEQLPPEGPPEVALLGRSNVGKSSLLNQLVGQAQLARVSRTPGRTRLLNLFAVRGLLQAARGGVPELLLVDCPGYGYAKLSRSVWVQWGEMMQTYLERRQPLIRCLLLVDGMLPAQPMDIDLHRWLQAHERATLVVATKWDRLSGNEKSQARRRLEASYQQPILGFSAVTGEGGDRLRAELAAVAAD